MVDGETLSRAGSLADVRRQDLTLTVEHDIGLAKLQLPRFEADQRFEHVLGFVAPASGRQVEAGGLTVAWLAPGEWLLIGTEMLISAWLGRIDGDALAMDISHACTSFLLSGANARVALSAHCPLDLWPKTFPTTSVARSLLADTGLFIARLADGASGPRFRLIVDQTMGAYAARLIAGPSRP